MATNKPKSVAVLTMSTRTPRVGPHVSSLLHDILSPLASASADITLSQVDLATFNLPVFNEPLIPAMIGSPGGPTSFVHPASIAWSDEVRSHDAYFLVIPEYNYGLAGGTKNAVDYLVNEWKGKPVAVVSYGIQGGKTAGDSLRGILKQVGLKVVEQKVELAFSKEGVDKESGMGGDLFGAMLKGELGDSTKGEWVKEKKGHVEAAWKELVGLLEEEKKE